MTLFVDASAMVAVIAEESDGADLLIRLRADPRRLTSAVAIYEAVLACARRKMIPLAEAETLVAALLATADIVVVPIGPEQARLALDAHARFGKGRHPARLNMGDCFAYACARANGARLLYKGDDFALTDIEAA